MRYGLLVSASLALCTLSACDILFDTPKNTSRKFVEACLDDNQTAMEDMWYGGTASEEAHELQQLLTKWPARHRLKYKVLSIIEDGDEQVVDIEFKLPVGRNGNEKTTLSLWLKRDVFDWRISYIEGVEEIAMIKEQNWTENGGIKRNKRR